MGAGCDEAGFLEEGEVFGDCGLGDGGLGGEGGDGLLAVSA